MKKTVKLVLASCVALVVAGLLVAQAISASNSHVAPSAPNRVDEATAVKEIKGYKSWTRVNPEPVLMAPAVAAMCAPASPNSQQSSPHANKFITVYVNDTGLKAMTTELKPAFPVGSVIVKEKLPKERQGAQPELLTVMIKREQGFDPSSGDWEYMALNGEGTKIESRGKLANCQSCHLTTPATDYVFRTYLPDAARQNLR